MSNKHTPGPWGIQDDHGVRWIEAPGNDNTICEVHRQSGHWGRGSKVGPENDHEFQANARLIASAPELLAALHKALRALESCDPGDTSSGHVIYPSYDEDLCAAADEECRAAIAKATGA